MKHVKLYENFLNEKELNLTKGKKFKVLKDTELTWFENTGGSSFSPKSVEVKTGETLTYLGNGFGAFAGSDDVAVPQFQKESGEKGELKDTGTWGQLPTGVLKNI